MRQILLKKTLQIDFIKNSEQLQLKVWLLVVFIFNNLNRMRMIRGYVILKRICILLGLKLELFLYRY